MTDLQPAIIPRIRASISPRPNLHPHGERIVAGNAIFRGRAGEQVRRDYIGFVLQETDLRIHACNYGWCVF